MTQPSHAMKVYLDNLATTAMDPRVLDAMLPFLRGAPGNPAAAHPFGAAASAAVETARLRIANLLRAKASDITFVPSATAANNLAILGTARRRDRRGKHMLVSAIEHPSVLEPALRISEMEIEAISVTSDGLIEPDAVRKRLRSDTILVSVQAVNNEIGTVQPIAAIREVLASHPALLHCDAAQAPGKIALASVAEADLVTLSSHKAYGPAGVAALVSRSRRSARPEPVLFGGGQERGIWPGTLPVAAIVGFASAMDLAEADLDADRSRVTALSERLVSGLLAAFPGSHRNGRPSVPQCVSLTFQGIRGETLLSALFRAGVAVSHGSACAALEGKPSHVLAAIGLSAEAARRTLRFGPGRFTTPEEIAFVLDVVARIAARRT